MRAGIAVDQRPATGVNLARPLAYDIAFLPVNQLLLPYQRLFYLLVVSINMLQIHQQQSHQKIYNVTYQRISKYKV